MTIALDTRLTHRLIVDGGRWSKGVTWAGAKQNFKNLHGSMPRAASSIMYACTPNAFVNDMGYLISPKADGPAAIEVPVCWK